MTETPDDIELTEATWLDGLDNRERLFVLRYVDTLDVKNAAIRAGYEVSTAHTSAYGWISKNRCTKPHVKRAVDFELNRRKEDLLVTKEMVLKRLRSIAFADARELMDWDTTTDTSEDSPDGGETLVVRTITSNSIRLKASTEISDEMAAAIKELRQYPDGSIGVKLHDSRAALADLGKHLGIMDDRVRHMGPDGGPVRTITREMTAKEAAEAWQRDIEGDDA